MPGRDLLAVDAPAAPPAAPAGRDLLADKSEGPFDQLIGYYKGLLKSAGAGAEGLLDMAFEPEKTGGEIAGGLYEAASHPIQTAASLSEHVVKKAEDPSREGLGELVGDVAQTVAGGRGIVKGARALADVARGITPEIKAAKALEGARSEQVQRHKVTAQTVGLPPSDELGATPAGADLESTTGKVARSTINKLVEERKTIADKEWDELRAYAAQQEAKGDYLTNVPAGQDLMGELRIIQAGGEDAATLYTDEEMKAAKDLEKAISGLDKETPGRFPVDFNVIDKEYRRLRSWQHDLGQEGITGVKRKMYGDLADKVENAVSQWLKGKNVAARTHYKELSAPINKWNSSLGRKLAGRQDLEWVKDAESPSSTQIRKAQAIFASPETVAEAETLLGREQVQQLGARYISNNLRNKTAAAVDDWLTHNQWISRYPELEGKALTYFQDIAIREGDAARMTAAAARRKKWLARAATAGTIAVGGAGAAKLYQAYGPP